MISLAHLAETHFHLAQYDQALRLQQRVLDIVEKELGPEHPNIARSLNNLAYTYGALAQYDQALPLQQRVLAIFEKVQGPAHPDTALGLNNLALTYGALAQHDKALSLQQRALAIYDKVLGPEHPATAVSLNNLAYTYGALAQHNKALPLQQRALAIHEKVWGSEHPDTARSLNNLASTHFHLVQYDQALPLQQRALAIHKKVLGPEHPDTALSLNNLASTHFHLAQYDQALPLQQRALAIFEKVLGPEHPVTATSLYSLAQTHSALVQHDQALPLQQRALAILEKALGPEHPTTALAWSGLSYSLEHLQYPLAAIAASKRAVNIYQQQRERVATIGQQELASYTTSVAATYQTLARWLTAHGRLAEAQQVLDMLKENEQFDFVRRNASADPRRTQVGYTPTEQAWMRRYDEIAGRLAALGAEALALNQAAKLGLSPAQQARQRTLAADLGVARQAHAAYVATLREAFSAKGPARAAEMVETSVQATRATQALIRSLGDDVALLQYYVTDNEVGLLLTTAGIQLARKSVVKASDLNRQIAAFRRLLREPSSNPLPAAQALYNLLLAPVAQDLEQAKTRVVMLSLDGALRYVPFAALHDGQQYAAQRWLLPMYTSVVRDRLRDANTPRWQAAGLGVTRAVGEFSALPAVRAEVGSVVQTRATGHAGVVPGEVYLDDAFTAQRLKDVTQRPFQLLHVASHFRFSPGTEVNSFLLLGDGTQLSLGDIRSQNYRFDHVDLLTLSACDTGLGGGRDEKGREIEGFGVIAQQQGAKAVLATLWPVADQSTATLMADMYRRRQDQQLGKMEALRQAQLALMRQPAYAHPFYWSPFILMGNWK